MRRSNRELWLALIAILVITLGYLLVINTLKTVPAASGLFGHAVGILGFLLMLSTEILYSLRKRTRSARWGRMSTWLQFHIFTGLVGPYLVLLHTSWVFNGLAGIVSLFTLVIVASGFIGRYIYTAVPRTVDGAEVEADELERNIQATEAELHGWMAAQPETAGLLAGMTAGSVEAAAAGPAQVLERLFSDWSYRWQWRQALRRLPPEARRQAALLEDLQIQRRTLYRQLSSLAMARRMLGLWHTIHIPIGMALFTAAFIHIAAALYYTAYLR
jgi:hypothetical protein